MAIKKKLIHFQTLANFNAQLSAGRVQTPTLALIVNREKEISDFKAKEYFNV